MANFNPSDLQNSGTSSVDLTAGSATTLTFTQNTTSSYFTMETARNTRGVYDINSPKNTSGSFISASNVSSVVQSDYITSMVLTGPTASISFIPATNVTGSTLLLRGTGNIYLVTGGGGGSSALWNNLVHYYTADNTANDSKGVYNGVLVNGATYATGKINNGFYFDGVNDYMSTSVTSPINCTNEHTFACWVKPAAVSSTKFFMSFGAGSNGSSIGFTNGGYLTFFAGAVNAQLSSGVALPLNTWTHVSVVYKGNAFGANNVLFYVNGSLVFTGSLSQPSYAYLLHLGSCVGGGAQLFNGYLDECAVWNKALTSTEITELYNSGVGKQYTPTFWDSLQAYYTGDNTPNDALGVYNATLVNGPTYAAGKINNGFSLDGVNDYITSGNNFNFNGSTPFSFSLWVNFANVNNKSLFYKLNPSDVNTSPGYIAYILDNKIEFLIQNSNSNRLYVNTTNTISTGYNFITITYDGSKNASGVKIYVNSVNQPLTTLTNTFTLSSSNAFDFTIGKTISTIVYSLGTFDEIGIWGKALTASEVAQLYNSGNGKQYPN